MGLSFLTCFGSLRHHPEFDFYIHVWIPLPMFTHWNTGFFNAITYKNIFTIRLNINAKNVKLLKLNQKINCRNFTHTTWRPKIIFMYLRTTNDLPKILLLRDVTRCSLVDVCRCFWTKKCCLHFQCGKLRWHVPLKRRYASTRQHRVVYQGKWSSQNLPKEPRGQYGGSPYRKSKAISVTGRGGL
jgi:hypothetical protein